MDDERQWMFNVLFFSQYDNCILLSWKSCNATPVSGAKCDSEARVSTSRVFLLDPNRGQ